MGPSARRTLSIAPAQGRRIAHIAGLEVALGAGPADRRQHPRRGLLVDVDEADLGLLPGEPLYDEAPMPLPPPVTSTTRPASEG